MKRLLFCTFLLVLNHVATAQRDTINLNTQWQFSVDAKGEGLVNKWFEGNLPNARIVTVPHTWNVEEANQLHYGWGWYQKKIQIPLSWKNKRIALQFGAINHSAYIYLNGKKVDENIGDGYSKFDVDLTGKLRAGVENTITIAVNNDYGKTKVPYGSSFDWPNDGGIIRKSFLIARNPSSFSFIKAFPVLTLADSSATLKLLIGRTFASTSPLKLTIRITEDNQRTQRVVLATTLIPTWEQNQSMITLQLPKVHPWHFDFPNLYKVEVSLLQGTTLLDQIRTHIGFRDIKFSSGNFILNGEPIKLMGVEWTSGSNPQFGFAETDSLILSQGNLMKQVNAIFTRQHFQQDDLFYDFCDRNGILVQQEIPLWGPETPANDTIRSIAMKQIERMIFNYHDHPSIFSWGVGNELRGRDTDMKQMIAAMIATVKVLDSSRQVAYVSNTLTSSFYNNPKFTPDAASEGDYLMMNEYGGSWWELPTGKIHTYLDSVHVTYPDKPFFISEFGLCEPNFKGGDTRRIEDLLYHMAIYESKPYVQGAIYFDLTDYRTHYPGTSESGKFRQRIHGIYDMTGQPKASMCVLRELASPVEVQQVQQGKRGKLNVLMFGSIGLPQHVVRGYKMYISTKENNYLETKPYNLSDLSPGQRLMVEVDELNLGNVVVTVVRPNGYIVSQKSFY